MIEKVRVELARVRLRIIELQCEETDLVTALHVLERLDEQSADDEPELNLSVPNFMVGSATSATSGTVTPTWCASGGARSSLTNVGAIDVTAAADAGKSAAEPYPVTEATGEEPQVEPEAETAAAEAAPPRRRGGFQIGAGEPSQPLFDALKAEGERRGLSLQKTSLSLFGNKARIYALRGDGVSRRKTADKIRAWIASVPGAAPLPPPPASDPPVVQVPPGVRKLRPYCRQRDACVAPSRGPCRLCNVDAVHAGVKRRITHQAEALLAGEADGKTSGGAVHPAVRAAANNIDATRQAQARQTDPVEAAKLALQRKGRTVYEASVCGGQKGHFHVSGMRDGNGRLLELTPAALINEAERVTGQSFRRKAA